MIWKLFYSFFKIGSVAIGGGLAMIPLMEREVVEHHAWFSKEEFLEMVSLSQSLPGIFAANMAATVGYRVRGVRGAVAAVVGNVVTPIVLILLLAMFFRYFRGSAVVEHLFMGLRPAVVALIAAPVFNMAKAARLSWRNAWIPVVVAAAVWLVGVNPVVVILVAAALGLAWGWITKKN